MATGEEKASPWAPNPDAKQALAGSDLDFQQIPGYFAFQNLYRRAVETAQDGDTLVEIGVFCGRSIAWLAREVIRSGKKLRIVGIDPWIDDVPTSSAPPAALQWDTGQWRGRPTWGGVEPRFGEACRKTGGAFNAFAYFMHTFASEELERITVVRLRSHEACRLFDPESLHMVFIDGDHSYEGCKADIFDWAPLMKSGGWFAGDDYHESFPGVKRAVDDWDASVFESDGGLLTEGTTWWRRWG